MPKFYIYILTNKSNKVFYIGITNNLFKRTYEHKNKLTPGFASKYNLNKLVYFEDYKYVHTAIERKKQLKRWHRQWKINLIKSYNDCFEDLSEDWF